MSKSNRAATILKSKEWPSLVLDGNYGKGVWVRGRLGSLQLASKDRWVIRRKNNGTVKNS